MPNLDDARCHVRVGDILVSPRGTCDRFFFDLGEWSFVADDTVAVTMLEELGVKVDRHSSSSWQHDNWRLEGDELVIDMTIGSATPDPKHLFKRFAAKVVKDTLLLVMCPYKTTADVVKLKSCEYCVYAMPWDKFQCIRDFADWMWKPVVEVVENHKKYVATFAHNGWDWGEIGASLRFKVIDPQACVPSRWKSVEQGLRSTHCQENDKFIKYYAHSEGKEHVITMESATFTGKIESTESMELSGREDWEGLKCYRGDKVHHVLQAFAEACWWARGSIEAIPVQAKAAAPMPPVNTPPTLDT